jgi:hypothetical protein
MVPLGAALVIAPTDVGSLWPWPLTPLTGRAVGTFVLSQGVLVLTVCRECDWGRVRPAVVQYVVLGVLHLLAIARFADTFDWGDPAAWLYLGFIVSIAVTAVYGVVHVFGAVRDGKAPDAPALYRRGAPA